MVIFKGILKDKNSLRTRKYSHYNFILSNTGTEHTKRLLSAVMKTFLCFKRWCIWTVVVRDL